MSDHSFVNQRLLWLVAVVSALVACEAAGGLPTHHLTGAGPTALLEGRLTERAPCIYVQSPSGHEWVVIWPRGYGRKGLTVVEGGQNRAVVGQPVRLGGGEYHAESYDFLRTLMDQDLDPACRGGDYWLATAVL